MTQPGASKAASDRPEKAAGEPPSRLGRRSFASAQGTQLRQRSARQQQTLLWPFSQRSSLCLLPCTIANMPSLQQWHQRAAYCPGCPQGRTAGKTANEVIVPAVTFIATSNISCTSHEARVRGRATQNL